MTGADPQRLAFIKGADARNIYVLRDWEDSRKIWDVTEGKRIVIVGSSFIGMETAASLVRRSASVVVVGMEKVALFFPFPFSFSFSLSKRIRRRSHACWATRWAR